MSRAQNADIGAAGETQAAAWRPELALVDDTDDHRVDGYLVEDVVAEIGTVETVVAEEGTPVEVKTVALRKAGRRGSTRRGELHIRRENHAHLLAADGEYVIVIYDGDRDDVEALEWVRVVMLSARTVDCHITTWTRDRRYGHDIARVPWSRLLDTERVETDAHRTASTQPTDEGTA